MYLFSQNVHKNGIKLVLTHRLWVDHGSVNGCLRERPTCNKALNRADTEPVAHPQVTTWAEGQLACA